MSRYRDEDDVRVRPGRRSRPRSSLRPAHNNAEVALVTTIDRGRYTCALDDKTVIAMRARELGRRGVVVGDRVAVVGDLSGKPDALARIVRIEERTSELRRSGDDTEGTEAREKVIVANAQQLVIVVALADPPPRTGLIDRALVAAEDAGIDPLLCLTKSDLAKPDELLRYYGKIDLPHVVWQRGTPVDDVREHLVGRRSVLLGHSGVGKSTLVNALVPGADRATGIVSGIGKGRHTSTSAIALPLTPDGFVIDTPGVRSFGLAHIPYEDLLHGYPDLLPGSLNCEPGCDHSEPKSDCALDAWVAAGNAPAERLVSFRTLLASMRS
ncbi:MAG: ribosome small subunit-dependent GTPase A [Corynebacteriales bacterium]|nr:ribosome small subunit-dependent GTPase A [Mycobacteriales bacterium]